MGGRLIGVRAVALLVTVLVVPAVRTAGVAAAGTAGKAPELLAQADALYDRATTLEELREAYGLYKEAAAGDPGSYEAAWKAGRAAWQLAEWLPKAEKRPVLEEGRDLAKRAVDLDPRGVDGHYWHGVLIARVGEERGILASLFMVGDVVREMEATLDLDPRHAGAHYVLGTLYRVVPGWPLSVGDKKKAVTHAEQAVRYAPNDVLYRLGLAEAYEAVGDRERAVRTYREVLTMEGKDPRNDEAYREKARKRLRELGEDVGSLPAGRA
ncbi:tetratricopeptide repeat protein [Carboxydochorda subterranea]|uniref:Tetratricopeptide repeat protein n=1 Tax=Carboxydichorda subterranea TaxID=3109565 RepID=A0ABZ1BWS5_9FIRM|nr:tetratricopeptide repeat protein [Limnochorda sp. L945t]WRP17262.1 tetratricopeptide repeat protein [Limnochorda sp. L945t]